MPKKSKKAKSNAAHKLARLIYRMLKFGKAYVGSILVESLLENTAAVVWPAPVNSDGLGQPWWPA